MTVPSQFPGANHTIIKWTDETGSGSPGNVAGYTHINVQAAGTGTVTLEGSNDGTNFVALNDTAGAAVSLDATAEEMAQVLETPLLVRAVVAGGTATVIIHASR